MSDDDQPVPYTNPVTVIAAGTAIVLIIACLFASLPSWRKPKMDSGIDIESPRMIRHDAPRESDPR